MEARPAQAATDPRTFSTRASAIFDGNLGPRSEQNTSSQSRTRLRSGQIGAEKLAQDRPAQVLIQGSHFWHRFWPVIHGVLTTEGVAKYVCLTPAEQLGGRGCLSPRASWESEKSIAAFLQLASLAAFRTVLADSTKYLNTGKCISIAKRIGKTRNYWYGWRQR